MIVIGSGATGGIAALTFAEAGIRVLVVEAGPNFSASQALGSEPSNTFRRFTGIINGEKSFLKAEGLLATCIQHEIDHLEGILFIDYLSKLKKTMIIKKLSKQKSKLDRIIV